MIFYKFRDFFSNPYYKTINFFRLVSSSLKEFINSVYKGLVSFISRIINPNKVGKYENTPLYNAIENERSYLTAIQLLKKGAKANVATKTGSSPLLRAAMLEQYELAYWLIRKKANLNLRCEKGYSPLSMSISYGQYEVMYLLIENGADVNITDEIDQTALHLATYNPKMLYCLIKNGANVNHVDDNDETALYQAVLYDKYESVCLLIENGADVNIIDKYGNTLLDLAANGYLKEPQEITKSIIRMLISINLLENSDTNKPKSISMAAELSTLWDDCKLEIVALSKIFIHIKSIGSLSLWDFCKEKDENKLARIFQNEKAKNLLAHVNDNTEHYPFFRKKIQAQFQKGFARCQALTTACNSIFRYNTRKKLNEDCWQEILEKLSQEDLKNVTRVSALFFNKPPSRIAQIKQYCMNLICAVN